MDDEQVRRIIRLIGDYCERTQELRRRRIGKMSTAEFWNALVSANKAIKSTDDPKAKSEKIGLKHIWFNPEVLRSELGALEGLIAALKALLDEAVLREIAKKGYDSSRIRSLIMKGDGMVEKAKHFVGAWENAYASLASGKPVKADEISALEYKISGMVHGLEDAIVRKQLPSVSNVMQHPAYVSRRGFLGAFARQAAAAVLLGGASAILAATGTPSAYGQEAAQKLQEITDEEISEMMKKETVEEILKGANVEYVKYNPITRTTNYDALVFQKHLKPEERKPVLVLFYHNKDPTIPNTPEPFSQRNAIIFRKLSEQFSNKIKFVAYDVDSDPVMAANNYRGFNRQLDIQSIPSIAMYSQF
ncbi:MAG: hypothetical protein QXK08_03260, partial [Candidatus Woesearchaeota archaeon]